MEWIDVYWSFRSPYSYLATPDMLALENDYVAKIRLKVVFPIAIRSPEFFSTANEAKVRYIQLDWARRAEMLGMHNKFPTPDPIVQDMETLEIAEVQPYIYRLSQLGVEADRLGRGAAFTYEVSHLLFSAQRWNEGDLLAQACARAGLNLAEMEAAIGQKQLDAISRNHSSLKAAGHWGVPTFVFRGEPFFGQDRVETLRWRMDQAGVPKR
jgi:2-hydroxychromene-2-carboxylate isomerase